MAKKSKSPTAGKAPKGEPRGARVTASSAEKMRLMLEGRDVEIVARGPHRLADGTYVAEIIGTEEELAKIPRDAGKIEIHPPLKASPLDAPTEAEPRYRRDGDIPRGVGIKK